MQDHPETNQTQYWAAAAVLLLLLALIAAVFAINFRGGITALIGVMLALLFAGILQLTAGPRKRCFLLLGTLAVLTILLVLSVILFLAPLQSAGPPVITCPVELYRAVIIPETPRLENYQIQESVILVEGAEFTPPADWTPALVDNQPGYLLPASQVQISQRGFLLKEAFIPSPVICRVKAFVELNDFPLNTFYAVQYGRDLQRYPYIDSETITWSPAFNDIRFSYIQPPFQFLRPVLAPLIGATLASQWIIGIVSILVTLIFVPILQPILLEFIQKILKKKIGMADNKGT